MQALLNAINSLAGGHAEAAASTGGTDTTMPQLVIIDAFSAVIAPILGRQHMQGTLCAGLVR
jgi:ABC-type amino acid transport system permease subunit